MVPVDSAAEQLRVWQEKVAAAEADHEAANRIRNITGQRLAEAREGLEITKAAGLLVLSEHRPPSEAMGATAKSLSPERPSYETDNRQRKA